MKYGVLDSLDKIQKFENTYSQICFANLSDITPYQCFSWVYNYAKYFIGQNVPHIIRIAFLQMQVRFCISQ